MSIDIKTIYSEGFSAGRWPNPDDEEACEMLWQTSDAKKLSEQPDELLPSWKNLNDAIGEIILAEQKKGGSVFNAVDAIASHLVFHYGRPPVRESSNRQGLLDGWQPIETAPKDGTAVLLYKKNKTDKYWCVVQASWFEGQFYADSKEDIIDWDDGILTATHWMPLTKPTSIEGQP